MATSKILLRLQSIVTNERLRRAHDPQLWIELFVTANLGILAADIYIAHSVNHFQKAAEYIPLYFSIGAPAVLAVGIALRWIGHFEAPWRDVGYMVGWLCCAPRVYGTWFSAFGESDGRRVHRGMGSRGDLSGAGRLLRKFCPVIDRSCVKRLLRKDRIDSCYLIGPCDWLPDHSSRA